MLNTNSTNQKLNFIFLGLSKAPTPTVRQQKAKCSFLPGGKLIYKIFFHTPLENFPAR